jgi:hypothetical protein
MPNAFCGETSVPSAISCSAAWMPMSRGKRTVPPPPGSRPSLTSGWPSFSFGSSSTKRAWQASAISSPPPNAWPLMAATTGLPAVSRRRSTAFICIVRSKAC